MLADRRFSVDATRPGYPARGPASRARRTGRGSFITMDAPEHTRLRRMLISEFTVRRVEALRPAIERTAAELLDELAAGPQPADLVRRYALPLPSIVISALLGVPYEDHAFFEDRARAMLDDSAGGEVDRAATAELARYLGTLLHRRDIRRTGDLLGRLNAEQVETGALSRSDAVATAILLLITGHETTADQIALSTAFLPDNPGHAEPFRHPDGPPATAVDELLRLLTITHTGRRRVATADVRHGDVTIRAGDGVLAAADIANRDPDHFPDPDAVDLGRSPNHHLAFGHGEHLCLGHHLARLELRIALTALLRRLPRLRLAVPTGELPFRHAHPSYGIDRLPVAWD
ncbi:Cytochrome P450 [Amycolatopsis australiensis]|uniref:Cytochrome P450 n=1 Tax=Amycolatopsis australiensis TaxID=546364 RepID=A0A1K1R5G5_9PSEU|nr:Cytochrome P450 [Amycolatopsis australiensis]